jgi:hypothetical protein
MTARTFRPQKLLSAPFKRRFFRERELRDEREDSEQAGDEHGSLPRRRNGGLNPSINASANEGFSMMKMPRFQPELRAARARGTTRNAVPVATFPAECPPIFAATPGAYQKVSGQ